MADDTATITENNDTFECAVQSDEKVSHDFHDWPEPIRKASDAAVERLLADHPGTKLLSDTSQCVDDTHPRYPASAPKGKFFALRMVKLDQPVTVESSPRTEYSAAIHIRQFEDQHLGPDAVRINGEVERGSGSAFAQLSIAQRREYEALTALVPLEDRLSAARAELVAAEAAYDSAVAAIEKTNEG